ncbi:OmpH family outer membrane protein [Thalassoglobus polymorphus]|uniref:Outer membrane protein (OmpH-like) n=1 Tax=Thalassoglobus polymorphus TaxID=2527994 RepID=A0A517QJQ4_9PLAN|nr:OmpH family outer membrane protein [Thalassoglobus polymorphus]QDT31747.1 Outer membrane protein (OmpH-like) [Thalassoglobus polymorphus]
MKCSSGSVPTAEDCGAINQFLQWSANAVRYLNLSLAALILVAVQASTTFAESPQVKNHQVGLIDMAHVFKNYEKFKALTEALQEQITQSETGMKTQVEEGRKIQEQMKALTSGSPEFEKLEGQLLSIEASLKKAQLKNQREFMRQEAELYKDLYLETRNAVDKYARYYNYSLILRFDRSGVASADNPQEIVEGLNQQVLYHRNRDDLTDPILNYLNEQWRREQKQAAAPSTPSAQ